MTGQTLASVLTLLKAELGVTGTADDALLYQLIVNKQFWFAAKFDWSEFDDRWDMGVTTGSQYYAFPTVDTGGATATLRLDRLMPEVEVFYNSVYMPLDYGITMDDYNQLNPNLGQFQDPIQKWGRTGAPAGKFEVWPVPASNMTIRFTGQRMPKTVDVTQPNVSTLDLDDMLLALTVAAERLAKSGSKDAATKAEMARSLWVELRGNDPKRLSNFVIGRDTESDLKRRVVPLKIITVHG